MGIVMELREGKAVIMKQGGAFVSVPAESGWQRGDIVHLPPTKRSLRPFYALAACLALVIALGGGGLRAYFTQTALVSIDVNPSIELGLNGLGRVLTATAKNAEGDTILAGIRLKGQHHNTALAAIIDAENERGYLGQNADVVVTVFAADEGKRAALLQSVETATDAAIATHHGGAGAEYHTVDAQTIDGAHACGVTAGKYLYLEQLQTAAPGIDLSEYTHHSIAQLRGQIKACQDEHRAQSAQGGSGGTHGTGGKHGQGHHHAE